MTAQRKYDNELPDEVDDGGDVIDYKELRRQRREQRKIEDAEWEAEDLYEEV